MSDGDRPESESDGDRPESEAEGLRSGGEDLGTERAGDIRLDPFRDTEASGRSHGQI